jgi:hypothetical protein
VIGYVAWKGQHDQRAAAEIERGLPFRPVGEIERVLNRAYAAADNPCLGPPGKLPVPEDMIAVAMCVRDNKLADGSTSTFFGMP